MTPHHPPPGHEPTHRLTIRSSRRPSDLSWGAELRPEELPSAPARPPWPWADSDQPTTNEQPHTRSPQGPEVFPAPTARSRAHQVWTQPRRHWAFPPATRPLVIAGFLALAAGAAVTVPFLLSPHASTPVPSPPAITAPAPAPISPAAPAVTPTPVAIPPPGPLTPTPTAIPTPPAPHPATQDNTTTSTAGLPAPATNDHALTHQRSPAPHPAPARPPVTQAPQPHNTPPDWTGSDAPPAPAPPPCTTDCTQPTPARTPTHWTPHTP
jgi:hypothetical protein